jgi:hypothetical protein
MATTVIIFGRTRSTDDRVLQVATAKRHAFDKSLLPDLRQRMGEIDKHHDAGLGCYAGMKPTATATLML